jgi:hypothetical protein
MHKTLPVVFTFLFVFVPVSTFAKGPERDNLYFSHKPQKAVYRTDVLCSTGTVIIGEDMVVLEGCPPLYKRYTPDKGAHWVREETPTRSVLLKPGPRGKYIVPPFWPNKRFGVFLVFRNGYPVPYRYDWGNGRIEKPFKVFSVWKLKDTLPAETSSPDSLVEEQVTCSVTVDVSGEDKMVTGKCYSLRPKQFQLKRLGVE